MISILSKLLKPLRKGRSKGFANGWSERWTCRISTVEPNDRKAQFSCCRQEQKPPETTRASQLRATVVLGVTTGQLIRHYTNRHLIGDCSRPRRKPQLSLQYTLGSSALYSLICITYDTHKMKICSFLWVKNFSLWIWITRSRFCWSHAESKSYANSKALPCRNWRIVATSKGRIWAESKPDVPILRSRRCA